MGYVSLGEDILDRLLEDLETFSQGTSSLQASLPPDLQPRLEAMRLFGGPPTSCQGGRGVCRAGTTADRRQSSAPSRRQ
jgi:hypothetical protein